MRKIVINSCFGGFGLSDKAFKKFKELKTLDAGLKEHQVELHRDDPILVHIVEELGEAANGGYAKLKVVEIPDDVVWEVTEYDGWESVEEVHRSWS